MDSRLLIGRNNYSRSCANNVRRRLGKSKGTASGQALQRRQAQRSYWVETADACCCYYGDESAPSSKRTYVKWQRDCYSICTGRTYPQLCVVWSQMDTEFHGAFDLLKLNAQCLGCKIFLFNRVSTCVEAHWLRLHRIWNRLHRIFCVTYLSDMYEHKYDTSARLIRVQFIVQPSLEIATCLVYGFPRLRRLRVLPSGPTALTTGRRDRTGIFVFIWCEWG